MSGHNMNRYVQVSKSNKVQHDKKTDSPDQRENKKKTKGDGPGK